MVSLDSEAHGGLPCRDADNAPSLDSMGGGASGDDEADGPAGGGGVAASGGGHGGDAERRPSKRKSIRYDQPGLFELTSIPTLSMSDLTRLRALFHAGGREDGGGGLAATREVAKELHAIWPHLTFGQLDSITDQIDQACVRPLLTIPW